MEHVVAGERWMTNASHVMSIIMYVLFLRVQRCAVGLFPARKQVIVGSNPRRGI
jgi:hypothetical protein